MTIGQAQAGGRGSTNLGASSFAPGHGTPVVGDPGKSGNASGDLPEAARAIGLQIHVLKASTSTGIEAAFATLVRDRAEALYVAGDTFFTSRRVQFATLAASYWIPASYPTREAVEAGGLMTYATSRMDMCRQVGAYSCQILKGAKPADLPVVQSTKFEFVIILLRLLRAACVTGFGRRPIH